MAKQTKDELVVLGFDYSPLEAKVAKQARSTPGRIRERLKKTLVDLIEFGSDLLAVKEALPHGQFGPWLKAEFGWSERTVQNFMSMAQQFKSANYAVFPIQPSASYLLAAPAGPDEARQLREFADALEKQGRGSRKKAKECESEPLQGRPHRWGVEGRRELDNRRSAAPQG